MNAAMTNLVDRLKPLSVELFKFAAACSLLKQPNDVGHMYAILRWGFKTATYKYDDNSDDMMISQSMMNFKVKQKDSGIDMGSFNIFWKFFKHLDDALLKAYTRSNIAFGWLHSGIVPHDASRIMSGYGFWSETAEGPQILDAIAPGSALVELAQRQGQLYDRLIEDELSQCTDFDSITAKDDDAALLNRQCLWLSYEGFLMQ